MFGESFDIDDYRNLHETVVLAGETIIIDVLSSVIAAISPQDTEGTDNLAGTKKKEGTPLDEFDPLSDPLDLDYCPDDNLVCLVERLLESGNSSDVSLSLRCLLIKTIRSLRERVTFREDLLERYPLKGWLDRAKLSYKWRRRPFARQSDACDQDRLRRYQEEDKMAGQRQPEVSEEHIVH
jgi:hypothetical protein